jgi:hypothetical protein
MKTNYILIAFAIQSQFFWCFQSRAQQIAEGNLSKSQEKHLSYNRPSDKKTASAENTRKPQAIQANQEGSISQAELQSRQSEKHQRKQHSVYQNKSFDDFTEAECFSALSYAADLTTESERLSDEAHQLRQSASTKKDEEKTKVLKEAEKLAMQSEQKQIQAADIEGKVRNRQFRLNEIVFNNMLITTLVNEKMMLQARALHEEGYYAIKMAREMREEANSIKNKTSRIGTISNAEEKESLALKKQVEAIALLKK